MIKNLYQPGRGRNAEITVRAFEGLSLEYGVRRLTWPGVA